MTTRVEFRKISVTGPNPAKFTDPISLTIVLEVFEKVPTHAIDVAFVWTPIWDFPVDQELDEFEVGPFEALGVHEFALTSDPPDFSKIPDPTGPTALLLTLSYQGRQFLHVGYNVIVTCEGDIPDVFTSADCLTRRLERCYPRQTLIEWDAPSAIAEAASSSASEDASEAEEAPSTPAPEGVEATADRKPSECDAESPPDSKKPRVE